MLVITLGDLRYPEWEFVVDKVPVGVLGATSVVGSYLLSQMASEGYQVAAFSRRGSACHDAGAEWRQLFLSAFPNLSHGAEGIERWISLAPIWVLPEHFSMLEAYGVRRLVALSSTSRFTKDDSSDPAEQVIALRLSDAEARVQKWADSLGVEWTILRPTLIYGLGRDKNVSEIARFIRRLGFFPLLGKGRGLRQPLHAQDVARACIAAMNSPFATNQSYNLSGAETVCYRNMAARIFNALGRPVRLISVPKFIFRFFLALLRVLPRYRSWSFSMAERMDRDLVFDHSEATRDFGFNPRPFTLSAEDVSA